MSIVKLLFFLIFFIIYSLDITAQSTPMPTSSPGSNSLIFNSSSDEYYFQFNSETLYMYDVSDGGYFYNSGATLNAVKAKGADGNFFKPSNVGGICAAFSTQSGIVQKAPWDSGITYKRIRLSTSDDTVIVQWRMISIDRLIADSLDYIYRFHISGKTLVIRVQVCNGSTKATSFDLDRCENASYPRVIRVPYLTLFNLLNSNDCYTSLFFDWETTNASSFNPKSPDIYDVRLNGNISLTSKRFTQIAYYNPKTDGQRNTFDETIYLTTSSNINDVLPNLVIPSTPPQYKTLAASKTVFSYGPPYTWLLTPPVCSGYRISTLPREYQQFAVRDAKYGNNYKILNLFHHMGIEGLAVIAKNYQRLSFDNGYPKVLPANSFPDCENILCPSEIGDNNIQLEALRDTVVNKFNYLFALHENYIDAYDPIKTGSGFSMNDCSLGSDGVYRRNWKNGCGDTSYVISPGKAADYLTEYSREIKNAIFPNWSYLDLHSAINAADVIDYNAEKTGAGLFRYVVQQYRSLANILRDLYHGPVEGEGGCNHSFMYVGYFDDLEARLHTADNNVYGYNAPIFVDFDLYKMHSKSAFHGVGHISSFFAPSPGDDYKRFSVGKDSVLIYIATELAYGHSGLISKSNIIDHTIYQALLEYKHVYPVQQDYSNARPVSILYGDEQVDASTYIKNHSGYADINSPDFMSKVKVTYDNGIIVCVNRNPSQSWDVTLGETGKWFSYHAIINERDSLGVGQTEFNSFTLPPRSGWAVYDPLR